MTATAQPRPTRPAPEAAPRPRRDHRRRVRRPRDGHPPGAERRRGLRGAGSATATSAARGGRTRIPAASATSPRTSTRSRSPSTPTGAARTRPSPRSRPTSSASRDEFGAAPARRDRLRGHERGLGRDADRWSVETDEGRVHRRRRRRRARPAERAVDPGPAGPRHFAGTTFHTADWNHDHDLTGRRVAVVGTGASAIQAVPEIQPRGRAADGLPAHAAVGRAPPRPADHRRRARALPPLPGAAARGPRRRLLRPRAARPRPRVPAEAHEARPEDRAPAPRAGGRRPRAARASSRPTTRSAASGSCRATAGTRRSRSPTSSSSPTAIDHVRPDGDRHADGGELRQVDTIIFATGFHVTDIRIADRVTAAAAGR